MPALGEELFTASKISGMSFWRIVDSFDFQYNISTFPTKDTIIRLNTRDERFLFYFVLPVAFCDDDDNNGLRRTDSKKKYKQYCQASIIRSNRVSCVRVLGLGG